MGSSVVIVTKLWAAQPGHGGLILGRSKRFIFLFPVGAHASSYSVGRAVTAIYAWGQVLSCALRPCTAVLKILTFFCRLLYLRYVICNKYYVYFNFLLLI